MVPHPGMGAHRIYRCYKEIGITASWWCEILVPNFVIEQLEHDIVAGFASKITIGVKWVGGLVFDQYAPPAFPNTWGLLREADKKTPEIMSGYVTSIGWGIAKSGGDEKDADLPEPVDDEPKPDATAQAVAALSQEIIAMSRRVYRAFIIVAVVIVIAYLLR